MANNDIAIRFCNEKYCTKKEVQDTLKIPMIDNIWNGILEYRSSFMYRLTLKHFNGFEYSVCLTPNLAGRINSFERKLIKSMTKYSKLESTNSHYVLRKKAFKSILEEIAKIYNINVQDNLIENIITGNVSVLPPDALILNRYYSCLKFIEENFLGEVSEETFLKFNGLLTGDSEQSTFRTNEIENNYNKVLINKVYLGIPVSSIDGTMSNLVDFIHNSNTSLFVKAVCAFYAFYYIKPFETYCEEVGILLLKLILANNDVESVASLFNFEQILNNRDELENVVIETQKTRDLTYLVQYFLDKSEVYAENFLDEIARTKAEVISHEVYKEDSDTDEEIEPTYDNAPTINLNRVPQPENQQTQLNYVSQVAIGDIPVGLSEQEATRLEMRLKEMNPNLSNGEAFFYARHCTLGMCYTISQYKKELGCAYETARSSMDKLVYLGYYRKELLKNKFIYTPVRKN